MARPGPCRRFACIWSQTLWKAFFPSLDLSLHQTGTELRPRKPGGEVPCEGELLQRLGLILSSLCCLSGAPEGGREAGEAAGSLQI